MDCTFMSATIEMSAPQPEGVVEPGSAQEVETSKRTPSQEGSTSGQVNGDANRSLRKRKHAVAEVIAWFAACARCSFFLAGYRFACGIEELESAVSGSKAGWLALNWSQSMCQLVRKSYGSAVDMDCFHLDGSCPECHRQFVYHAGENGDQAGRFRIEVRPQSGRQA